MARQQPSADAFLADLDAKGIAYTVGPTCRAKLIPDARYANRPDGTIRGIFAVVRLTLKNSNSREHWASRANRVAKEIEAVRAILNAHVTKRDDLAAGCTIILTRLGVRMMDSDNLPGAFKAVRDAVGQWLLGGTVGQMDDDERLTWVYRQVKVKSESCGITIGIEPREATA